MIMIAIIKVAGLRISGKSFDLVWDIFWQQVEASVAVITVSFTAFRAILVARKSRSDEEKRSGSSSYSKGGFFRIFRSRSSSKREHSNDSPPSPGLSDETSTSVSGRSAEKGGRVQIKTEQPSGRHWWNMGIVSDFTTTASEDV